MADFLRAFFDPGQIWHSLPQVLHGFVTNLEMMLVAEALVLVWALLIALARLAPGPLLRPLRWLAIGYIDFFRGIPLVVLVMFVGLGIPIALGGTVNISLFWLAVTALVLGYGAYVAEVYRAGIQSIHPSQVSAARSLGLSARSTMRFVVLPQAVRRVLPPLLNDFISLQKDTALAGVLGVTEAYKAGSIYAGQMFNVSSLTGVALCFVIITIPLTRIADRLLASDAARMAGADTRTASRWLRARAKGPAPATRT